MLALVTGATGFIGRHLVRELLNQGHQVRALVRKTSDLSVLPDGIQVARGDLQEKAFNPMDTPDAAFNPMEAGNPAFNPMEAAVHGVEWIFHLAGLIRAVRPRDYASVNATGTERLLDACLRANPKVARFVLVSSLAAAGPSPNGRPRTEADPEAPISDYGRSKRAGELAAVAYADRFPITVVRPPIVYGPGDRLTLPIFRVANLGLCPTLGADARLSLVHSADLSRGLIAAAEHPAAVGRTYFMSGAETATIGQITGMIAAAMGRRSVPVPVPYPVTWSAACFFEACSLVLRRPVMFDRLKARDMYQSAWCCDSTLAQQELGYSPQVSLADGFRETALWYKQHGWL
jgi:nucleoside-diphosphate-sugar epimerase